MHVCACVNRYAVYSHLWCVYVYVCVLRRKMLGIFSEQNEPRYAEKNMLHIFSSNAAEDIRVKLQKPLSGTDLG